MIDLKQRHADMTRNLAQHVGTSLTERIMAFAHTGVLVGDADDMGETGAPLGLSRLGGDALLPPGTGWPGEDEDKDLCPFELAAVIDLAVVGPMDPDGLLPHHGVLNFFVDENGEGDDVIHADTETAVTTSPPERGTRHEETPLYGRTVLTVPASDDLRTLAPNLAHEVKSLFANGQLNWEQDGDYKEIAEREADEEGPFSCRLIGGWPSWVQGSMFSTPTEHLLFDLQGDGKKLDIGGAGSNYLLIEEQDLRAGNFDNAEGAMGCL